MRKLRLKFIYALILWLKWNIVMTTFMPFFNEILSPFSGYCYCRCLYMVDIGMAVWGWLGSFLTREFIISKINFDTESQIMPGCHTTQWWRFPVRYLTTHKPILYTNIYSSAMYEWIHPQQPQWNELTAVAIRHTSTLYTIIHWFFIIPFSFFNVPSIVSF